MDLKLTITCEVEGQEKTYGLEFAQELVSIGRHSMNDVQIPDKQVSAEHARLLVEDDQVYLVDLGSALGTLLNGERANPHQRRVVGNGDEMKIGDYRVVIGRPEKKFDDTSSEKTAMVAMKMVREVLGSLSSEGADDEPPYLEVENDAEAGTRLDLKETGEYRLGREKDCELVLKHWSISRKHALIQRDGDGVTVRDLGSKNGVLVNGEKVDENRRLRDGDVVAVGHTEVRFRNPSRSALDSLDVGRTPVTNLRELGIDAPSRSAAPPPAAAPANDPVRELARPPEPAPVSDLVSELSRPPERSPEPEPEYRPFQAPAVIA